MLKQSAVATAATASISRMIVFIWIHPIFGWIFRRRNYWRIETNQLVDNEGRLLPPIRSKPARTDDGVRSRDPDTTRRALARRWRACWRGSWGARCSASTEFALALPGVSYGLAWAARSLRADHDQRAAGGVRINPARDGLSGQIGRHRSFCPAIGRDYYLIITTAHQAFGRARAGRANEAELR